VPASRVCMLVDQGPEPLWARLADFPGSATVVDWSSRYDCDRGDEKRINELLEQLYREFIANLASA
jgi:hypothetical protein